MSGPALTFDSNVQVENSKSGGENSSGASQNSPGLTYLCKLKGRNFEFKETLHPKDFFTL